ncbi:hypothetical protein [Rhizobium sp. 007]|uniref:hypothetical protein n=1 Tax=Rhizobium sp. 007 TaxID=2785056 RepID=UPI0018905A54|nr:hypothetical protein [Rhizobium sp. 007]QPB22372.1 hypothetical protein ISN39_22345 [Rhizobium sp. 007]
MKIDFSFIGNRLAPANILFAGVSLLMAGIAATELSSTAKFSDLTYLSSTLSAGDAHNKEMLRRMIPLAKQIVDDKICRSDLVEAGLYFILLNLDIQNSFTDFDGWAAAMGGAETYIRHGLTCNPTNGYLWGRLAMVRQASGENSEELSQLLTQSALFNPTEINALRVRFFVWRRANARTLALASDAVSRDVRVVLSYADIPVVKEVFAGGSADLKPYVSSAMTLVSRDRLDLFAKRKFDPTAF